MKLSILLLIIGFLQVSAKGYSQIKLNEKNSSLEKLLSKIKKQTNYNFIYDENTLKISEISVTITTSSIQKALDACFRNLPVTYTIIENNVILKRKILNTSQVTGVLTKITLISPASISGTVLNEDKKPVEGASVLVKGTDYGTTTDSRGYFHLAEATDSIILKITCIGYLPVEIGIRKLKNGYKAYAVKKEQAEDLKSAPGAGIVFTLVLKAAVNLLAEFTIKDRATKQLGTVVDLKHRSHLTLGEVLEGSVPGLTLKSTTSTDHDISYKGVIGVPGVDNVTFTGVKALQDLYNKLKAANVDLISNFSTFDSFYNFLNQMANSGAVAQFVTTTTNNGLTPELRGSSSFTGNTSGMLVVIDGVPQDGFPANYPMNNVAKVQVVKDPVELIKWGPKATGGLILITTNGAKAGQLLVNYTSNFSYSDRPNISNAKLQLASTAQILAEYKEQVDKGLASYIGQGSIGLKPAQLLLYNYDIQENGLGYNNIKFKTSWDSLARLSNRDQLRMLYQNSFIQTQSLNISGGTQVYRFTLGGVYSNTPGSFLGSDKKSLNLNLQNIFSLLKNKLKITWQLNTRNDNSKNGTSEDGSELDPYQMLLIPKGRYVYNYQGIVTFDDNKAMQQLGYLNYGANPLEDARNTKNASKTATINSILNVDWNLTKGLQWSTAFLYDHGTVTTHNLTGAATSQARQLIDTYGSPDSLGGVDFYVPQGGILNTGRTSSMDWNLRSGLSYNHSFDTLNVLNATLGIAAANTQNASTPNAAIYGYGPDNQLGLPILNSSSNGIMNYQGVTEYPTQLLVPGLYTATYDRNLAINGSVDYTYSKRYTLNLQYSSVYTPDVGFFPSYSGTVNYAATASWQLNKEHFFKLPFFSAFTLSATASEIQLGKTPGQITTNAISQSLWNNTALEAAGYTPSQLNGQQNNNIGGAVQMGLRAERIHLQASYNHSSNGSHQVNGQFAYDIYREPWFNVPFISNLVIDASLQDFNALQAQAIVMGTTAPNSGGGYSLASNNSFGTLPPATVNKEVHLGLGLFKDRLTFDLRYYHKIINSTSGSGLLPPDPATGLSSQISDSRLLNKGVELYLKGRVIKSNYFTYAITINSAYNINQALDVPNVPFAQYVYYLTSPRNGYATDALWSYRWAGLDNKGNPQVYEGKNTKVPVLSDSNGATTLDASSISYSGLTRAPWSGGLIQEWEYKNFFASARLIFNLGYIMRTYTPVAGPKVDDNYLIGQRWEKTGDEVHTDIAAMAQDDPTRTLVIQNSSNSIVSADNIRLREVQLGYEMPQELLEKGFLKALTISFQVENVALWTRNKLGLDPEAVNTNGMAMSPIPRQYVLTINASF